MNKYFLSIISILLLFQSFKVFDELFYHNEEPKGSKIFSVTDSDDEDIEETTENVEEIKPSEEIDIDSLFVNVDLKKGEKISKQCSACHDFSVNLKVKIGPPLWGVVGRKVAAISDYKYSDSFMAFEKDWSRETLFYFLENPKEYIKGTKMIYKGLKKNSDRVNLISYLESLK